MKLDVGKIDCLRLFFACCSSIRVCVYECMGWCILQTAICAFHSLFFNLPFVGLVPIVFQVLSLSQRASSLLFTLLSSICFSVVIFFAPGFSHKELHTNHSYCIIHCNFLFVSRAHTIIKFLTERNV